MKADKNEFVNRLDGSFYEKLRKAFRHAYALGVRDGVYIDRSTKNQKQLDIEFKEWIKRLEEVEK